MGRDIFARRDILTSAQIRALEDHAMRSGAVTGLELMARAGAAVVGEIRLRWPKPARACVLCGPGNNGGDGYVIARLLHRAGWRVRVLGAESGPSADAAEMKRQWLGIGTIEAPSTGNLLRERADLYVDAIFGTGLTRPLDGDIAAIIRHLGGADGSGADRAWFSQRLVAVDGPSGLCLDSGAVLGAPRGTADQAARACLTVSFDSPRPGHVLEQGPELCGRLVIADIGLDQRGRAEVLRPLGQPVALVGGPDFARKQRGDSLDGPDDVVAKLGKRAFGHKFSHGHALILAGGAGQGGAARLAAKAALRVGAGLVTLAPPEAAMAEHLAPPEALMRRAVDRPEDLAERLEDPRITSVLLGPGSGVARAEALLPVLLASGRPCVLDADALTALSHRALPFEGLHARCVLTPHLGEFARLFPDIAAKLKSADGLMPDASAPHAPKKPSGPPYSKLDAVREASARAGAVVLLKGPDTVIAGPKAPPFILASVYDAGVPWLATAGSGDVLAGLIAGLLARGFAPAEAARVGATLHAAAGRAFGAGLIADDLPDMIPVVLGQLGL